MNEEHNSGWRFAEFFTAGVVVALMTAFWHYASRIVAHTEIVRRLSVDMERLDRRLEDLAHKVEDLSSHLKAHRRKESESD